MNALLLAFSLLFCHATAPSLAAALRIDGDESTFMVQVTGGLPDGYQITIDCTEKCTRPVHYREATGDTPLGLFSRDQNDLAFSTWSGGSAYRVKVWSVAGGAVRKVLELSSRSTPNFLSDAYGRPNTNARASPLGCAVCVGPMSTANSFALWRSESRHWAALTTRSRPQNCEMLLPLQLLSSACPGAPS